MSNPKQKCPSHHLAEHEVAAAIVAAIISNDSLLRYGGK
jgi:hypothetical protein